ncbi:hypothetical protein IE81DRAFT_364576 [Ceraceosorus guamensis]|uniref:Mis18 domain-containing protein n=1 Tax=Ceraceosorus guamensis TaxID=1522189 RepID=A0A316W4S1_9BASI|nr:hypothetical protein IE81DRAFT_364576 [Ceraceosorus guamensis]PWN44880.1 hypothetical protein IE81DRAFT_364576 [Ceraceosorus guamensis]
MSRASSSPDELDAAHPRANAHRASVRSTSSPGESPVVEVSSVLRARSDRDESAGLMRPPALPRHIQQARTDERMSKRRRYGQARRSGPGDEQEDWSQGLTDRPAASASSSRIPMGPPALPSPSPRPSPMPLESPAVKREYSTPVPGSGILSPDPPPTNRRLDFLRGGYRSGHTNGAITEGAPLRHALAESVVADEEEREEEQRESREPEEGEDSPLLVFQCDACGVVLGDSFSWVAAQRELGLLVLSSATDEVVVDRTFITSTEGGLDVGSTYSSFTCSCGAALGRMYRTTSRALDDLRDAYSFQVTQVRVYQLGTSQANAAHGHPQRDSVEAEAGDLTAEAPVAEPLTALASTHGEQIGPNEVFDTVERGANRRYVTPVVTNVAAGIDGPAGHGQAQTGFSRTPVPPGRDDQRIRVLLMGIGERLVKLERQMESLQQASARSESSTVQAASSAARPKAGTIRSHSTSEGEGSVMSEQVQENGAR